MKQLKNNVIAIYLPIDAREIYWDFSSTNKRIHFNETGIVSFYNKGSIEFLGVYIRGQKMFPDRLYDILIALELHNESELDKYLADRLNTSEYSIALLRR